jgi:hypothetical protein
VSSQEPTSEEKVGWKKTNINMYTISQKWHTRDLENPCIEKPQNRTKQNKTKKGRHYN